MIEYHKVVKHYDDKNNFQIFVFRFERNDNQLIMYDLFIITLHNGCQSKVRINIQGLCENIFYNPHEQLPENEVDDLYKIMESVLDEELLEDREIEILDNIIESSNQDIVEELINAADMATVAHPPTVIDFDEYVKQYQDSKNK